MSETTHTPGPWHWYDGYDTLGTALTGKLDTGVLVDFGCASGLFNADGEAVCVGSSRNDGEADCEATSPANARLIAASPDLLADLKDAAATFRAYAEMHRQKKTPAGDRKARENFAKAERYEATIAKAQGR